MCIIFEEKNLFQLVDEIGEKKASRKKTTHTQWKEVCGYMKTRKNGEKVKKKTNKQPNFARLKPKPKLFHLDHHRVCTFSLYIIILHLEMKQKHDFDKAMEYQNVKL